MKASVKGSVAANPRNGSRRICLVCACWEPTSPSPECSHEKIALLDVNDREFAAVAGLAEAAERAKKQRESAVGALGLLVQRWESSGNARVQATHVDVDNVVSLHLRRASVRVG